MLIGAIVKGLIYKWLCAVEAIKFPIKSYKGLKCDLWLRCAGALE